MINCLRPDQIIRLGTIQPAGCAVVLQRDIRANAASYAGNPMGAQQYANSPVVMRANPGQGVSTVPSGPTANAVRRPNFLARFFGAR